VLLTTVGFGILLWTRLQPDLCLQRTGVITVGEIVRLQVGQKDLVGECRPDGSLAPRFTWQAVPAERRIPWQSSGPTVDVQADGSLRGVAPGTYAVVGRHAHGTEKEEGIVLPAGWTMRLLPEDQTIAVGESVRYRVLVLGPGQEPLPQVPFSVVPAPEQDLLRMSGLEVDDWVEYTAVAHGRTTVTGHVGRHSVATSLTVAGTAAEDP